MSAAEVLTTISPTTNQPILVRQGLSEAAIPSVLAAAGQAFQSYRLTALADRQAIVERALSILFDKRDALATELTVQMGRPVAYTGKEVERAVERGRYMLKISDQALCETKGESEPQFLRFIRKEPIGPVLIIFAWNYPYLVLVNSLVPALLAGNPVILKPSPQTPTVAEHVAAAFEQAGLPNGVLQYFHSGSTSTIEAVVRDPTIAHICFTGSVAGGLSVQRAAADRIVSVGLELGGNDPAYVRADVDLDWAATEIVDGAVFNSGQSCCAIERVYVHAAIYESFVNAVQKVLCGYQLGDPLEKATHLGPVISQKAKQAIQAHIQDALDKGAKDETPPNQSFDQLPLHGNFVKPTLLTGVDHSMVVMREETFGPVIAVMKVGSDDEAVRLMNDSDLGLTASVWSRDVSTATKLAERVDAGTVFVNRCDFPSPDLAWTGWKNSGRGVTLSPFGFDQFVRLKSFHVKDYPSTTPALPPLSPTS